VKKNEKRVLTGTPDSDYIPPRWNAQHTETKRTARPTASFTGCQINIALWKL